MTKVTFYDHHFWCFHVLRAALVVTVLGFITHIALFSIQIHRRYIASVFAHGVSILCYLLTLLGLHTNRTKFFVPYFLFNPVALLVQVLVEIYVHYAHWWKRKNFRWIQRDYFIDLSLLIILIILIVLTHCLMVSIIYRVDFSVRQS